MRAFGRLLHRHRPRDLERDLAGIHIVIGTVDQLDLHVDHGISSKHSVLERFFDALLHRSDVLTRDHTPDDLVLEHEAGARARRLDVDDDVAVLTLTA